PDSDQERVIGRLRDEFARTPAFKARLRGYGVFRNATDDFHAKVEPPGKFRSMRTPALAATGQLNQQYDYHPHVTLAQLRREESDDAWGLLNQSPIDFRFWVNEAVLLAKFER